jgi:Domain of unknown function (DUF5020)
MKILIFSVLVLLTIPVLSQNLQLHYDFRHTVDPGLNSTNYPTFSFEYFKNIDTISTGSFLLKVQTDLNGKNNNAGQVFTQISQSLKFWKPNIYLSFTYSGGLGVPTESAGYYITNSVGTGASYPFQWKGAWVATSLSLRVNFFRKRSYDPQATIYFGKGFLNYRIFTGGSFTFWTENRNQGTDFTRELRGKKFAFFGDPQIWIKVKNGFSAGSRISVYYNLLSDGRIEFYPTLGTKYQF